MGLYNYLIKYSPIDTIFKFIMCYSPLYFRVNNSSGMFLPEQRFISIPCGKCADCRVNHSKEWAVKCMCHYLALPEHLKCQAWFLTLTYDDEHNPNVLIKRDLQLFFKRLRKHFKFSKIKYFAVGEYGSKTYRPHYHMIIFNVPIPDLVHLKNNIFGDALYTSETISKIWGNGICCIGELSVKSASYTARYSLKKYGDSDIFQLSSNGFGKDYFFQNMKQIISQGFISLSCDGRIIKSPIPKYFLKLYRKEVGDLEYLKFLRYQNVRHIKFEKELNNWFPDKRKLSSRIRKQLKDIGCLEYAVKVNLRNKQIIKQSLYDLYNNRDFNL
ncbi:replication initiator protein [Peromfec virus RodF8_48]|uniref:Replication initiator protein n=1 Tax=Peromfec virus RodF8_48 TaxID=2929379 RepID=A0A976R6R0_9VIRU|nr:replication initiator protein [Peromfec virus RodF8_48]